MTIIRSIKANVYIIILCNEVAWYDYIYSSAYRPDDGHVIDRNM